MFSTLAFYCDDPSSNSAEVPKQFYSVKLCENNNKEAGDGTLKITFFHLLCFSFYKLNEISRFESKKCI